GYGAKTPRRRRGHRGDTPMHDHARRAQARRHHGDQPHARRVPRSCRDPAGISVGDRHGRRRQRHQRQWIRILVEHDLFGKPASTLGSSPRAGFFRIMLYAAAGFTFLMWARHLSALWMAKELMPTSRTVEPRLSSQAAMAFLSLLMVSINSIGRSSPMHWAAPVKASISMPST